MLRMTAKLVAPLAVILVASSCAVSEERSGPAADGIHDVVFVCATINQIAKTPPLAICPLEATTQLHPPRVLAKGRYRTA